MTIRQRTAVRRGAARATAAVLAGVAALHAAWAAGSTFPASGERELARLVVGTQDHMPSAGLTWAVAAAIGAGALAVAQRSRPRALPAPWERLVCTAGRAVAVALAVRGAGGLASSALGLTAETDRFRFWNLALYSPLCLLLAAGALAVWTRPRGGGQPGGRTA